MADTGKTIGLIKALASVDPSAIQSSVEGWLDDHPEATTTVQDGSITKAKLDSSLQETVDDVGDLKSAVGELILDVKPGYFNANGGIANPTASGEVYTNRIDVVPNVTSFHVDCAFSESNSIWFAIAQYTSNGTFSSRRVIINSVTAQIKSVDFVVEDSTIAYIAFTWRAYGESDATKISVAPSRIVDYVKQNSNVIKSIESADGAGAGKALFAKSVSNGSVSGWEYKSVAVVDNTLSVSGDAADAKVVGDIVRSEGKYDWFYSLLKNIKYVTASHTWENDPNYLGFNTPVLATENITFTSESGSHRLRVIVVGQDGSVISDTDWKYYTVSVEANSYFMFCCNSLVNDAYNVFTPEQFRAVVEINGDEWRKMPVTTSVENALISIANQKNHIGFVFAQRGNNIRSVNHRGYNTIAPENTLPAYKLSKEKGFIYVETDVEFTSDNVPVLLHDASINRTARNADGTAISGTVNISDITYEEALEYDFGIWKNEAYEGTKIPTFEQFIALCRNIGLHPYIELKNGGYTQEQINSVVAIVKAYGMLRNVTWISFNATYLGYVKSADSKARLGYVCETITNSVIETASGLKTDANDVFVDAMASNLTGALVEDVMDAGLPLEVWTVNQISGITSLNPYVSGVTSNSLIASDVMYQYAMSQ